MSTAKYIFEESSTYDLRDRKKCEGDESGSLTYSATSSIHSAGESTDSSFAEIMRVLDGQDVSSYLKSSRHMIPRGTSSQSMDGEKSVTNDSLAYSTDAESHMRSLATDHESALQGADYLSTHTGQQSEQNGYAGGSYHVNLIPEREDNGRTRSMQSILTGSSTQSNSSYTARRDMEYNDDDETDIMFAPAEHAESVKQRKEKRMNRRLERRQQRIAEKEQQRQKPKVDTASSLPTTHRKSNVVTPDASSSNDNVPAFQGSSVSSSTPPQSKMKIEMKEDDEDDALYAKWWMFCFHDTFKIFMPTR